MDFKKFLALNFSIKIYCGDYVKKGYDNEERTVMQCDRWDDENSNSRDGDGDCRLIMEIVVSLNCNEEGLTWWPNFFNQ